MAKGYSMFKPNFKITPRLAKLLKDIEGLKHDVDALPITPKVLASLRETARIKAIHYSTRIEGNRLTEEQVAQFFIEGKRFAGRERDQKEIAGYNAALAEVANMIGKEKEISESFIKKIHALVMAAGKSKVKATAYRAGQNVIREAGSNAIVYLPPEAKDVPVLMRSLVAWINKTKNKYPAPLRAAIAHYQFATIHPYYDGNGRTARLLATYILHKSGYGLKGIYELEEYYAKDLAGYYNALTIGPSHNYYLGREEADISAWVEYFCKGMKRSFEDVKKQAKKAAKH